jgi:hypothetical protein
MKKTLALILLGIAHSLSAMDQGEEAEHITLTPDQVLASIPTEWGSNGRGAIRAVCHDMVRQSQSVGVSHIPAINTANLATIAQFYTIARDLSARMTAIDIRTTKIIARLRDGLRAAHARLQRDIDHVQHNTATATPGIIRALHFDDAGEGNSANNS